MATTALLGSSISARSGSLRWNFTPPSPDHDHSCRHRLASLDSVPRKVRLRNLTFVPQGGACFVAPVGPRITKLWKNPAVRASTLLLENGSPIGPQTDQHESIRRLGRGRFSLWGNRVYLSASDSSNCRKNGRKYTLWVPSAAEATALAQNFILSQAKDSAALLRSLSLNGAENNSLVSNFFKQFQAFADFAGEPTRRLQSCTVVIVGSGQMPWTPMRFLAEGCTEVFVNDLLPVTESFEGHLLRDLADFLNSTGQPDLGLRLSANVREDAGVPGHVTLNGLTFLGEIPIEGADIPDRHVDLVYSVSVLEHVSDPRAVYSAFRRIVRPGGYMYHSIDLRDHRFFADPLAFLTMSGQEYATIATENRLRVTDHLALMAEHGFEVIKAQFQWSPVLDFSDDTDWTITESSTTADDVKPKIAPGFRSALNEDFAEKEAIDLATQSVQILARAK